jgi:hypothetical protein
MGRGRALCCALLLLPLLAARGAHGPWPAETRPSCSCSGERESTQTAQKTNARFDRARARRPERGKSGLDSCAACTASARPPVARVASTGGLGAAPATTRCPKGRGAGGLNGCGRSSGRAPAPKSARARVPSDPAPARNRVCSGPRLGRDQWRALQPLSRRARARDLALPLRVTTRWQRAATPRTRNPPSLSLLPSQARAPCSPLPNRMPPPPPALPLFNPPNRSSGLSSCDGSSTSTSTSTSSSAEQRRLVVAAGWWWWWISSSRSSSNSRSSRRWWRQQQRQARQAAAERAAAAGGATGSSSGSKSAAVPLRRRQRQRRRRAAAPAGLALWPPAPSPREGGGEPARRSRQVGRVLAAPRGRRRLALLLLLVVAARRVDVVGRGRARLALAAARLEQRRLWRLWHGCGGRRRRRGRRRLGRLPRRGLAPAGARGRGSRRRRRARRAVGARHARGTRGHDARVGRRGLGLAARHAGALMCPSTLFHHGLLLQDTPTRPLIDPLSNTLPTRHTTFR